MMKRLSAVFSSRTFFTRSLCSSCVSSRSSFSFDALVTNNKHTTLAAYKRSFSASLRGHGQDCTPGADKPFTPPRNSRLGRLLWTYVPEPYASWHDTSPEDSKSDVSPLIAHLHRPRPNRSPSHCHPRMTTQKVTLSASNNTISAASVLVIGLAGLVKAN